MGALRDWLENLQPAVLGVLLGGAFALAGQLLAQILARGTAERTLAQQRLLARDAALRARRERLVDSFLSSVEEELEPHRKALVAARQGDPAALRDAATALLAAEVAAVSVGTTLASNVLVAPAASALAVQRQAFVQTVKDCAGAQDVSVAALEAAFDELLACYRALRLAAERYIFAEDD